MRKTITLLTIILLVVFMVGCENAVNPTISETTDLSLAKSSGEPVSLAKKGGNDGGDAKVEICHLTGNGKYVTISVDVNAVQSHLDHGDEYSPYVMTGEWKLEYSGRYHHYKFDEDWGTWWYGNPTQKEIILSNVISCDGTVSFLFEFLTDGRLLKLTGTLVDDTHMEGLWTDSLDGGVTWTPQGDWSAIAL